MKSLLVYRILTYALILVAGFLSLMIVAVLPSAFANPLLLLFVFLLACVVIYSYTSWRFLTKGVDGRQYLKPSLRDLVRVNSYFTVGIAFLCVLQSITLLTQPQMSEEAANQALANMPPDADFTKADILKLLQFIERFFLVYGLVLLIHAFITYRLLRQYRAVFEQPEEKQQEQD